MRTSLFSSWHLPRPVASFAGDHQPSESASPTSPAFSWSRARRFFTLTNRFSRKSVQDIFHPPVTTIEGMESRASSSLYSFSRTRLPPVVDVRINTTPLSDLFADEGSIWRSIEGAVARMSVVIERPDNPPSGPLSHFSESLPSSCPSAVPNTASSLPDTEIEDESDTEINIRFGSESALSLPFSRAGTYRKSPYVGMEELRAQVLAHSQTRQEYTLDDHSQAMPLFTTPSTLSFPQEFGPAQSCSTLDSTFADRPWTASQLTSTLSIVMSPTISGFPTYGLSAQESMVGDTTDVTFGSLLNAQSELPSDSNVEPDSSDDQPKLSRSCGYRNLRESTRAESPPLRGHFSEFTDGEYTATPSSSPSLSHTPLRAPTPFFPVTGADKCFREQAIPPVSFHKTTAPGSAIGTRSIKSQPRGTLRRYASGLSFVRDLSVPWPKSESISPKRFSMPHFPHFARG